MRVRNSIAALAFLACVASTMLSDELVRTRPKTYGTQDQIVLTLGPCDAHDRNPGAPFRVAVCDSLRANRDDGFNTALPSFPLHLPEGALIDEVDFAYHDTVILSEPSVSLARMGQGTTDQIINDDLPLWEQGDTTASFVVIPPHEVHNEGFAYVLNLGLDTVDAIHYQALYNVTIRYRLQVSPAPEVATFNDVPTSHPFFQYVEALAAAGITGGCGGGNYCPDAPLTRGQMAVFLSKALGLHWSSNPLPN